MPTELEAVAVPNVGAPQNAEGRMKDERFVTGDLVPLAADGAFDKNVEAPKPPNVAVELDGILKPNGFFGAVVLVVANAFGMWGRCGAVALKCDVLEFGAETFDLASLGLEAVDFVPKGEGGAV